MDPTDFFAQDYAAARARFLKEAEGAGATLTPFENPAGPGPQGETLATDVAYLGAPDAPGLLIVVSGTHGAEGFCGSGCQSAMLGEGVLSAAGTEVGVLLVHAINPYGFAFLRRVNEDNVDLNRNSVDHGHPPEDDPDYAVIHPFLIPEDWDGPARAAAEKELERYLAEKGMRRFQQAVSKGQYRFPKGLFYGGSQWVWSTRIYREILARFAHQRQRIAVIDLHTGLGPSGYGEPIYTEPDANGLARARAWYGPEVTSTYSDTSTSAFVQGPLINVTSTLVPGAEVTALALEFGTLPLFDVMQALRAEHWLHAHPEARPELAAEIKRRFRDSFYVDTPEWKRAVYARTRDFSLRALTHLAA